MTDIKRVGDSGVYTKEGMVAGARAAGLTKQREKEQAEYEKKKNAIKDMNTAGMGSIASKFASASEKAEHEFKKRTIGLVTADDFRKAREVVDASAKEEERKKREQKEALEEKKKAEREKKRKMMTASLSFADDEANCEEEDLILPIKKKIGKDKTVDTSFLPDKERDRRLQEEQMKQEAEWMEKQEKIKREKLEVTYSYWDGSGHRRTIIIEKGMTIGRFLEKVKSELRNQFRDLQSVSAEDLMYVKEDLIIPADISFYDLIVTKARGKSGPLFHFDVHDDIRMVNDATIEKDESHPGKIVQRRWYERNKHIFPASRWEVYDPTVQRSEGYTIHGNEVHNSMK